tara:strand:+ start:782 stop:1087 length:306 start_codon:yes stop_codon:yes gene_type:complete
MKQVIAVQVQSDYVNIQDVTDVDRYYGVQADDCQRGFIMKSLDGGDYRLVSPHRITMGNNWPFVRNSTLQGLIKAAQVSNQDVFEFDSPVDMFKWVLKSHA